MSLNHDGVPEPDTAADLFIDFANTLGSTRGVRTDRIDSPERLLTWLAEYGLMTNADRRREASVLRKRPAEGTRRLARFHHLRDVLHAAARRVSNGQPPTQSQLRDVNHILRHGLHYHQLRVEANGTRYAVAQIGDALEQARATIASSFAHFLADEVPERLRVCDDDTCAWLFVDRSPTGRRRWCDMRTCGNRAKVARHRAKARAEGTASGATSATI